MSSYRTWAYLTFKAKEEWGEVFPSGRVPIVPIAVQRIRFDRLKDPESVFAVDYRMLKDWQREALFRKLGQVGLDGLCLGRFNFFAVGSFDTVFWRSPDDY